MTENNPTGGGLSQDMLEKAKQHYCELTAALQKVTKELAESDSKEARGVSDLLRQHWKNFQTTFDMEQAIENLRRDRAGIVHGYAIDLEEAGFEVGRRLARLRRAGGSGGLSEGSE